MGSVTTGVDLTPADHAVVEQIKKLFGIECTLFHGDTRVTTTLMKDGQRVIGTKMDNPKVLDTVLAKGQPLPGHQHRSSERITPRLTGP